MSAPQPDEDAISVSMLDLFQNVVQPAQQNQRAVQQLRGQAVARALREPQEDTHSEVTDVDDFVFGPGDVSETDRPKPKSQHSSNTSSRRSSGQSEAQKSDHHQPSAKAHNDSGSSSDRRRRVRRKMRTTAFSDQLIAILAQARSQGAQAGGFKVARPVVTDPDEAQRMELVMQLNELRLNTQGKLDIKFNTDAPVATLEYTLQRYNEMITRNNDVSYAIEMIRQLADTLESFNRATGPWLPLDGYGRVVAEASNNVSFRYAVYRLIVKYRGASTFSPTREIALALLLPILKAILTAITQWAARGSETVGSIAAQVQGAAHSAMTFVVGSNPAPNIPQGVPDDIFPGGRPRMHPVFEHDPELDGPLMRGPSDAGFDDDNIDVVPPIVD